MSQSTERNLAIGGVVLLLLFLLLRHQAMTALAIFAPPLPDEEKLTPGQFSADDYPLETLRHPQVPSLKFVTTPPVAPEVKIVAPNFDTQTLGPVNVNWPHVVLQRPTYFDLANQNSLIGDPMVDTDGIGSSFSYFSEGTKDFTLIGFVPDCEC